MLDQIHRYNDLYTQLELEAQGVHGPVYRAHLSSQPENLLVAKVCNLKFFRTVDRPKLREAQLDKVSNFEFLFTVLIITNHNFFFL